MKTNRRLALLLCFLSVSSSCLHAQTAWHLRHPLPSPGGVWGGGLFGVTYGNGQFVAVGYGGTVLTSTNAVTWTSRFPESDGNIYDVAYGNGKFVAVGGGDFLTPYVAPPYGWDSTTVLASADGTTWTETAYIRGFRLWRLVFANELFVGFGSTDSDGPVIVTSPDGVTWTERWRGKEIASWDSAVTVAVGNGTIVVNAPTRDECAPQSFLVSTNSLSWVEAQTGLSNGCIQSLHLSYGLGKFVGVVLAQTSSGVADNKVLISGDGFTREIISENWDRFDESRYVDALGFGNGSFFVLSSVYTNDSSGNDLNMPIALTSTDGRSWTEHSVNGLQFGYGLAQIHRVSKLLYAQNVFVIVGQPQFGQGPFNGFPYIFTSPDGMNWSRRVGGAIYGLSGVAASDRAGDAGLGKSGTQCR